MYLDLLSGLDALYPTPDPVHLRLAPGPRGHLLRPAGYLHLQLTSPRRAADKLKYLAGSEAAMGAFINDTTPESVAERLRAVTVPRPQAARPPTGPAKGAPHDRADGAAGCAFEPDFGRPPTASGRHRDGST